MVRALVTLSSRRDLLVDIGTVIALAASLLGWSGPAS
jgi:hypothetical protein